MNDEILYEYVLNEIDSDTKINSLWAKAIAHAEGDSDKLQPLYMQYRVESLKTKFAEFEKRFNERLKSV